MNHGIKYQFTLFRINKIKIIIMKKFAITSPYGYFDLFALKKYYFYSLTIQRAIK